MNYNLLKKYYYNSPTFIKQIYSLIPFNIRNGLDYRKWRMFLKDCNNDKEYSLLKIKETVNFAYFNIPYYKKLYKNLDIHPKDIKTIKDFKKLPLINKDIVNENFNTIQNPLLSKNKYFYVTTGGTTGAPTKFLQSNNVWKKELAFVYDLFEHYGYLASMRKVSFRGGEFNNIKETKFWKQNPLYNETHFSPFHITEKSIYYYVNKINKIKAPLIHGYPSSIINLIHFIKKTNLKINYIPQIIMLISEDIVKEQIDEIRSFFNCKVASFYGHSERLIFAPNLNGLLNDYTLDNCYGFTELLDKKRSTINKNNIEGEIIGTSFDNYMMPLIRYSTNDFTSYKDINKSKINLIKGRWEQEYLIGIGDTKISLAAINLHSDVFKNIAKYQYYQTEIGISQINCIVNNDFSKEDIYILEKELNKKTKNVLKFKVNIVNELELSSRGKFKQLISNLSK